jgi:proteasome lid subunit RPN8/RPN11
MKQKRKSSETPRSSASGASTHSNGSFEISSQVIRDIRQHARSSMAAEICGVLIGDVQGNKTIVEASIAGEDARQGGSHVTFTQDTWTHIYRVKDSKYPEKRIVGWYHSHPGFGIFLSDHDLFIHKNFFSDPSQVAWVYDPHSDEEGCFSWRDGEVIRLEHFALRDDVSKTRRNGGGHERSGPIADAAPHDLDNDFDMDSLPDEEPRKRPNFALWIGLTISHIVAVVLGAALFMLLLPLFLRPR